MTLLLDSGIGQELHSRGFNANAKVAGLALLESPAAVRNVTRNSLQPKPT